MTPKYSIGELVILQSKQLPDYNGEHVIRAISMKGSEYTCRISGITFEDMYACGVAYIMEEILPEKYDGDDPDIQGQVVEVYWDESSLRKKHQPGELSFQELMNSFNIKEKA